MNYQQIIARAKVFRDLRYEITTGDASYPGTAIEVSDNSGIEIFHIVLDNSGESQFLFFPISENFRIPVSVMEGIISKAKEAVKKIPD